MMLYTNYLYLELKIKVVYDPLVSSVQQFLFWDNFRVRIRIIAKESAIIPIIPDMKCVYIHDWSG